MDNGIEKLAPWCALNRIFGFSPKSGMALIRHFGGASEVFRADRKDLAEAVGAGSRYPELITDEAVALEIRSLEELAGKGDRFICIDSPEYPALLKECEDPPIGIYLKSGSAPDEIFGNPHPIAIVGTRDISSYGIEWCTRMVEALAGTGARPLIVSGLAIGTDITAHLAALDRGLPTVAVMATGTDAVYPFRHGFAADRIAGAKGSGLVTDYPPGTCPRAINFLRRNRIIAGLCRAVILIESRTRGGGLLTCRLAYSYNRDVYALPGRIDDTRSGGCNKLIHSKIAEAVYNLQELVSSLGLQPSCNTEKKDIRGYVLRRYSDISPGTAERSARLAEIISGNRDCGLDELCRLAGMDFRDVSACVNMLEMDGIVVTDLLRHCSINPKII